MTGFFLAPKYDEACSAEDRGWASRLSKLLIENRRASKANVGRWADEFRRLRPHHAPDEIDSVLTWLELNLTGKFAPRVFSAQSFRSKFDRLLDATRRSGDDLEGIEVTDDARKVSRNLGGLIWPKDEKRDELKAIQVSLNNYRDWLNRLRVAKVRRPDQAGLIDCLLALGGDPLGFVETWFARLHRVAWEVEGWAGKLGRHVVKSDSPKFRKIVNGWLQEYLGQGEHWDRLETFLKEGDRR
jgi:hypothetical protein